MEASDSSGDFVPAGLASLGIEADEVDLAVIAAAELERANGRRWVESMPPLAEAEPTGV